MAHMVESLMLLKNPAWHGLGTIIQDAPDSATALKVAGLDWEIIQEEMSIISNGQKVDGFVANRRATDGRIMGVVTPDYKVVQNKDAFAFVDNILQMQDAHVTFESAGSLYEGKRVFLLAHLPPQLILGDEIVPYLFFTNGHDGKHGIMCGLTPTRIVCANTLTMAINGVKISWKTKHTTNIETRQRDAIQTLNLATQYMGKMEEEAEKMEQTLMTATRFDAILNEVFPLDEKATDRVKNNNAALKNKLTDIYCTTDDLKKFRGTAWGVYNAFGDFCSHIEPLRKTDTFQENVFAEFLDGHSLMEKAQKIIMKVCAAA